MFDYSCFWGGWFSGNSDLFLGSALQIILYTLEHQ